MKPFTLDWWLKQLNMANARMVASTFMCNGETMRMLQLARWIKKRIINKYGE